RWRVRRRWRWHGWCAVLASTVRPFCHVASYRALRAARGGWAAKAVAEGSREGGAGNRRGG
ncbi:MAG: hypothetical protein RSD93_09930, partial [Gordonibacter sp.]|uniref:hypothetical protein n=1 Tax=Gordonibacter sp. TaxID=1968902 RepID=UPI002FC94721